MTELQLVASLETIAGGLTLAIVLFWLVPLYRVDVFRQKMYALRDEYFDFALAGNISFDDPAYTLLRKLMNGLIRYGHKLTLYRLLITFLLQRVESRNPQLVWNRQWETAIDGIKDPRVKARVHHFHSMTILLMSRHLISGSPLLLFILACGMIGLSLKNRYIGFRALCRTARDMIMSGLVVNQHFIEEQAVSTRYLHKSLFGLRPLRHH